MNTGYREILEELFLMALFLLFSFFVAIVVTNIKPFLMILDGGLGVAVIEAVDRFSLRVIRKHLFDVFCVDRVLDSEDMLQDMQRLLFTP